MSFALTELAFFQAESSELVWNFLFAKDDAAKKRGDLLSKLEASEPSSTSLSSDDDEKDDNDSIIDQDLHDRLCKYLNLSNKMNFENQRKDPYMKDAHAGKEEMTSNVLYSNGGV